VAAAPAAQPLTQANPVEWVLGLLDAVGSQPLGARRRQCPNPGHGGDTDPSLSITARETGGVKLHCFAGCPETDILTALGLGLRQLYQPPGVSPRRYAATARLNLAFPPMAVRHGHPAARGFRFETAHAYGPAAGTGDRITGHRLLRWRLPTTGAKELEWETTLATGATAPGLMGTPLRALPLYLEPDVRAATALHHLPGHTHQRVLVVESESTVDSLHAWNAKLWASRAPDELTSWCATTWAGGAHAVNTDRLASILGNHPHTVLMPDFDQPGLACLRTMLAAGLRPAVLLGQPEEDARDLYRRLGPQRFARAVDHALATARAGRDPVVTVAIDRLDNLPLAGLGRLLANGHPTRAARPVPSTPLPRPTSSTSSATRHHRDISGHAAAAPPNPGAAARRTDRPLPRAQPTAASHPGPPTRLDGPGHLPAPPPPPPAAPRPRSPR
jgi:hypothetical protein